MGWKKKDTVFKRDIGFKTKNGNCEEHLVDLDNTVGNIEIMGQMDDDGNDIGRDSLISDVTLDIMASTAKFSLYNGKNIFITKSESLQNVNICVPKSGKENPIEYITDLHKFFGYSIVGEESSKSGQDIEETDAAAKGKKQKQMLL